MPGSDPASSADGISSVSDDDSADLAPVFPPYAERPLASYRYDALGRRVQTTDAPSFQAPDKRSARRWVPGDANANGTLAQAPALAGGSVTLTVFAGQNDVAKLDASGKSVQETAYGNPQGYDSPTAYFRLEKSLVWVSKSGKETKLLDDGDLSDADGRPEGLLRLAARFGRGGKLVVRESWKTYWYHLDRLGSVIAISDAQGKVLEQYRYDPFGKPYVLAVDGRAWAPFRSSGLGNAKLFTGRDYDQVTKTYWYRARTYSPSLGRFLQRDPLGYADGANPYAYVGNGPWGATDPRGTDKEVLILVGGFKLDEDATDAFSWLAAQRIKVALENNTIDGLSDKIVWSSRKRVVNIRFVHNVDEFDSLVRGTTAKNIVLLAHGYTDNVAFDLRNSGTGSRLTKSVLDGMPDGTPLSDKTLVIGSCYTGDGPAPIAQAIQDHYGFEKTIAPDALLFTTGEGFMTEREDNDNRTFLGIMGGAFGYNEPGEFRTFK